MSAFDYDLCPVISIENHYGFKWVHFLGYSYYNAENGTDSKPWRSIEYCGAFAPLHIVLNNGGVQSYDVEHSENWKQYIEDLSEEEVIRAYESYNAEEIDETQINLSTDYGVYIVFPLSQKM